MAVMTPTHAEDAARDPKVDVAKMAAVTPPAEGDERIDNSTDDNATAAQMSLNESAPHAQDPPIDDERLTDTPAENSVVAELGSEGANGINHSTEMDTKVNQNVHAASPQDSDMVDAAADQAEPTAELPLRSASAAAEDPAQAKDEPTGEMAYADPQDTAASGVDVATIGAPQKDPAVADVDMADAPPIPPSDHRPSPPVADVTDSSSAKVKARAGAEVQPTSLSQLDLGSSMDGADSPLPANASPVPKATSARESSPNMTKVSRDREDDSMLEEPAAKRAKTGAADEEKGDDGDVPAGTEETADAMVVDEPSTSAAEEAANPADPVSLYDEDGNPKALSDPSLDSLAISDYMARSLRAILSGIKKTKAGGSFRNSVETLWPGLWPEYKLKVERPIDITVMERRLRNDGSAPAYESMAEFKADVRLLYFNSRAFNGEDHEVTKYAVQVETQLLDKMSQHRAAEPARPDKKESKHHPKRHHEPRAPPAAAANNVAATPPTRPASVAPTPPKPPAPPLTNSPSSASGAASARNAGTAAALAEKPVENAVFPIPPGNNGVPLIRRDSAKAGDRPKRPIHHPKKNDLMYEPKKKLGPEMRFCEHVLEELMKPRHTFNKAFLAPVDPVALNIPSYHKIIKKPMDLGTMSEKLRRGEYVSAKDFEKDFSLIVNNCRKFNGEEHIVTSWAKELEELFKKEMLGRDKWMAKHAPPTPTATGRKLSPAAARSSAHHHQSHEDEDEEDDEEDDELAGNNDAEAEEDEAAQLNKKLVSVLGRLTEEQSKVTFEMAAERPNLEDMQTAQDLVSHLQLQVVTLRTKIAELKKTGKPSAKSSNKRRRSKSPRPAKAKDVGHKAGGGSGAKNAGSGGAAGGASRKSSGTTGGSKKSSKKIVIGELEKAVIGAGITELDGSQLHKAIDIIKRDTNQTETADGELELDINTLSTDAQIKIYDLVVKAFPNLRAEKEKTFVPVQAEPEIAAAAKTPSRKTKKHKPMNKAEQERRLQQLHELKANYRPRQTSNSEEPMESIEGAAASPTAPAPVPVEPAAAEESDVSSEEE